jgi:hypothetical protein
MEHLMQQDPKFQPETDVMLLFPAQMIGSYVDKTIILGVEELNLWGLATSLSVLL